MRSRGGGAGGSSKGWSSEGLHLLVFGQNLLQRVSVKVGGLSPEIRPHVAQTYGADSLNAQAHKLHANADKNTRLSAVNHLLSSSDDKLKIHQTGRVKFHMSDASSSGTHLCKFNVI